MTIEEAKDQVAKKYGYLSWQAFKYNAKVIEFDKAENEAIQLYGQSQYNQGIRDAAANAQAFIVHSNAAIVDQQSILKLIKP